MRDGAWIHGVLEPTSYVLPWVVILHIAVEGRMFGLRAAIWTVAALTAGSGFIVMIRMYETLHHGTRIEVFEDLSTDRSAP